MSEYKKGLLKGTLILTAAGLISRIAGFFYKIFLSRAIGAEQIGIYQLAMPLYLLAFSVCVTGIQSALSRLIAARFARQQPKKAFDTFFIGLFLSLFLSLGAAFLLYRFAEPLSLYGLREIRCAPLLRIFSFSLPMACVHACVTSYYYGRRRTGIPALGQLLEQGVRICVSFLCYGVAQEKQIVPTAALAAAGALAGELASCLFSLILLNMETGKHRYALHTLEKPGKRAGEILSLAVPLTLNHVMVTILHSTEAILIPGMLLSSGLSSREALSLYGVLTGMAMPMLFFPSAITNSIAVMLLSSVAEDQARGQTARIRRTIESTVHYCLLLGIFAAGVFFFFGGSLGTMLFGSPAAGAFLKILAFLSPFLYLNSTLSSILTGLGKTRLHFLENAVSLGVRIGFVLLAVPVLGIRGYLFGLLAGELTACALNLLFLRRLAFFRFRPAAWILKPAAAFALSLGICLCVSGWIDGLFPLASLPKLLLRLLLLLPGYLVFFPEEWKKYILRNSTTS